MSASVDSFCTPRTKSPSKMVRVCTTPEYIPTLGGSDILSAKEAVNSGSAGGKKTSGWGRIRNVAEIQGAFAASDTETEGGGDSQSVNQYGIADFQKCARLLLKSKKVIERVREQYSHSKGIKYLRDLSRQPTQTSFENLDDYDLKKMHKGSRRRQHLKLAVLQKQFLDELPKLREQSVREHLARKIELLRKIKSSPQMDMKLISELTEGLERPPSDQPTRRQSRLRQSIDHGNSTTVKLMTGPPEDFELSMAEVDQMLAVAKSREKIENSLDLPLDRIARLARLKQNVNKINAKFQNFVKDRKGDGETAVDDEDDNNLTYVPSRFSKPGMALRLFRKYSRIVVIVLQWISMIMNKRYDFEKELKSFVDIANEIEDQTVSSTMHEMGLSFDKKFFKANREISLSSEARKILTTRWQSRTPQMIKQVMNGLHSLRSLSEYPVETQEKLCRVAWYQTIGPKKLIIRQGHHAESFYFILSGAAFVKKMVQDPVTGENKAQVAARLTRGHSFGEIGLLFDTLRTATVESSTPMELLVVGKEDFVHIFMKAENPDEEADHIKFLRTISFMRHWPIDALKLEPGACLTHYFKRGTLITENDKHSEWIYFILSGSCISLKKLKSVKPRSQNDVRPKPDPLSTIILPELGMPSNTPKINSGRSRSQQKNSINLEVFDEMTKYYDSIRQYVPTTDCLKDQYRPGSKEEKKIVQAMCGDEVFIQVEALHQNDTFGLNTLKYVIDADEEVFDIELEDEPPILALVSRGAEVVMLSKKVFLKYADQKCRMHVREKIRVYPTERVMQDNMQREADWSQYKTDILNQCIHRKTGRTSKSAS